MYTNYKQIDKHKLINFAKTPFLSRDPTICSFANIPKQYFYTTTFSIPIIMYVNKLEVPMYVLKVHT